MEGVVPEGEDVELTDNSRDRVEITRNDGVRFVAVDQLTGKKGHATAYELSRVEGNRVEKLRSYTVDSKTKAREILVKAARGEDSEGN